VYSGCLVQNQARRTPTQLIVPLIDSVLLGKGWIDRVDQSSTDSDDAGFGSVRDAVGVRRTS